FRLHSLAAVTEMKRLLIVPIVVLLLTALHGPSQAQALFFDFLPFSLGTGEPITRSLTGVALLALARIGVASGRSAPPGRPRAVAAPRAATAGIPVDQPHRLRPERVRSDQRPRREAARFRFVRSERMMVGHGRSLRSH
ncbi:MAG TPA: hypothetical protein VLC54_09250, partial [Anaeromyxobacter sp.]|nr:hypothetical protein [Anaeromyxobacter sp.]